MACFISFDTLSSSHWYVLLTAGATDSVCWSDSGQVKVSLTAKSSIDISRLKDVLQHLSEFQDENARKLLH